MFSYNVTPPQFPPSYLSVASLFHLLIPKSSSVFLSTWPNHLSLASLIFHFMFATSAIAHISSFLIFSILFIPIIHLNILISVLSSKFCSAFPGAQVINVITMLGNLFPNMETYLFYLRAIFLMIFNQAYLLLLLVHLSDRSCGTNSLMLQSASSPLTAPALIHDNNNDTVLDFIG